MPGRPALLCWCVAVAAVALVSLPRLAQATDFVPGLLERVLLVPSKPYQVRVGIGKAKFLGFSCMGGPADVVISLSTYAEHADPLLLLSLDPEAAPSFQQHDASSFGQWREDSAGDHYVIAKAVGPKGGILGLVNMRHFASEDLDGILSIHCTFIVAFDTLFWDHLRSSAVCPVGDSFMNRLAPAESLCSGHGQCGKHGVCECDGDFAGPACEHSKSDAVVAADGHYRFQVAIGRYQYFRVRIPPRFPGGFLEVKVMAEQPLVVLVRGDDLPTKSNFELSNFDDWVNQRYISVLKYKVPPADRVEAADPYGQLVPGLSVGPDGLPMPPPPIGLPGITGMTGPPDATARRLSAASSEQDGEVKTWMGLLHSVGAAWGRSNSTWDTSPSRSLQEDCPPIAPSLDSPACQTPGFLGCQSSCKRCLVCVKGGHDGSGDRGCTDACNACVSPGCISTLAQCAANMSCMGSEAMRCEDGCGSCMACFDSNDERCSGCQCCIGCLPLAAKCSMNPQNPADMNRFAFVGVYNHRRYYNDRGLVHAAADISLTADPNFERDDLPSSWLADLYDPFHDISSLEITQRQVYPDGQQYLYELQLKSVGALRLEVRLYHDRLTLLHINNVAPSNDMVLEFQSGVNITHILSSSKAAPKTFFDFDQVHEQVENQVRINVKGEPAIWCALFGAADGYVQVSAKSFEDAPQAPAIGFALVCVFGLLCALLVLGVIYGGAQKLGEFLGMDPSIPLMERLGCLVRNNNPHESTASLTRTGSLTGYIGSDVIDRSVEDQYLHRGGAGDDGI